MIQTMFHPEAFLSPKVEVQGTAEKFVVCTDDIYPGELVVIFGGVIISLSEMNLLPESEKKMTMQIDDSLFSYSKIRHDSDYINHSCNPNLGFKDSFTLISMRNISAGEEVTFDYAMCDSEPFDEFICNCGSIACRGKVTGNDWSRPDLQNKYVGWFSPYLQRRIDCSY